MLKEYKVKILFNMLENILVFLGERLSVNMKKIAIFGAGAKGKELFGLLYRYRYTIECFIDNDIEKQGTAVWNIPIVSLNDYLQKKDECDLILAIKDGEKVRQQLMKLNIRYYTFDDEKTSFFSQKDVKKYIDNILLFQFLVLDYSEESLYKEHKGNWYRKSYYNDYNKKLINNMIKFKENMLNSDIYDAIYWDEYYENRCDMHLVCNLIAMLCRTGDKIIDVGAGHGFLLDELRKKKQYELFACEGSPQRCEYLKEKEYITYQNEVEDLCDILDASMDALVCMETLEHVSDVEKSVCEIARILRPNGYCWITVPEGALCDCEEHVRQFSMYSLGYLFKENGFVIDNIQTIPDFYTRSNGRIFMQCRRSKNVK